MNIHDCDNRHDALLLQQIAEGHAKSFELLYEKYWEIAYSDAYKRLKDTDQAKDIVQEIFTSIWLRRETLVIGNVSAYLKIAVRNKVFKVLAKQKLTHPYFNFLETMPAASHQPDANLLWQEFFSSYEALLNTLPAAKQTIFRLRFQEDLSTADIAHRLGLSRKTVQNQIGRAIEHLRVYLLYTMKVLLVVASVLRFMVFV